MSKRSVYAVAVGIWFVLLLVAFGLGTLRELFLTPIVGDATAHVLGTLAVVVFFLGIMFLFVGRFWRGSSRPDFWLIGLMWLVMTASFEFLFFHFVVGKPWSALLADYNVANGRIWVLVLAATLFGPPLIHAILRQRPANKEQS